MTTPAAGPTPAPARTPAPATGAHPTPDAPPVRVRVDLAYDGTGFAGWARQPGLRTVQGVVEDGLALVLRAEHRGTRRRA